MHSLIRLVWSHAFRCFFLSNLHAYIFYFYVYVRSTIYLSIKNPHSINHKNREIFPANDTKQSRRNTCFVRGVLLPRSARPRACVRNTFAFLHVDPRGYLFTFLPDRPTQDWNPSKNALSEEIDFFLNCAHWRPFKFHSKTENANSRKKPESVMRDFRPTLWPESPGDLIMQQALAKTSRCRIAQVEENRLHVGVITHRYCCYQYCVKETQYFVKVQSNN